MSEDNSDEDESVRDIEGDGRDDVDSNDDSDGVDDVAEDDDDDEWEDVDDECVTDSDDDDSEPACHVADSQCDTDKNCPDVLTGPQLIKLLRSLCRNANSRADIHTIGLVCMSFMCIELNRIVSVLSIKYYFIIFISYFIC